MEPHHAESAIWLDHCLLNIVSAASDDIALCDWLSMKRSNLAIGAEGDSLPCKHLYLVLFLLDLNDYRRR